MTNNNAEGANLYCHHHHHHRRHQYHLCHDHHYHQGANNRLRSRARTDHPGFYRFCGLVKTELDHVRCNCEQFEAGNLVTPQHSRARRTQKTRNQLKQLLENRQIGLRKYAIGQGQLNMVIKNKRKTGRQEDLGATLRGALASLGDEEDIEEPQQVRRGANGGRMRRARGAQGRGAAPRYKVCDGCGARLRSNYIRTHQRRHCRGPQVDNVQEAEEGGDDGEVGVGEVHEEADLHLDEVLDIVNNLDQTILGGGIGGRDEAEEEEALELQRRLYQQRLNSERTPPRNHPEPEDPAGRGQEGQRQVDSQASQHCRQHEEGVGGASKYFLSAKSQPLHHVSIQDESEEELDQRQHSWTKMKRRTQDRLFHHHQSHFHFRLPLSRLLHKFDVKDKRTLKPPSIVNSMKNLLLKVEVPRGQRAIDVVNNMLVPT